MKNFIDYDFEYEEEEFDEDYDELKNINVENSNRKTNLEKKSEFEYFKEVINYFSNLNNPVYSNLIATLYEEEIFLFDAIAKFDPNL